jgi:predicted RecB family nuclease
MSGLQCPKLLWWLVDEPEAEELEPDPSLQFLFDRGREVGRAAHAYVPGGVLIDVPQRERRRRLQATAEALRGGARVLYEPAFEHQGVLVVADILERARGGWNLIEVKSSTKVKPEHVPDVAVQAHVLRGAGLEVRRAELMHLNRECRHPDLSNLFAREDVTAPVEESIEDVPARILALKRALDGPLPDVPIGDHCHEPYDCPFLNRCWPEPPPHAIETLYRLPGARREEYRSEGYRTILDLPRGETLTPIQERQRRAARRNGLVVEPGLRDALKRLEPPFAYLDFETVSPPIPVWEGCRPYDQVPVQLSVHTQAAGGRLTSHEWLADGPGDPREAIARKLIEFTRGARTILAYNAPFERGCIQALMEHLPRLAPALGAVERRIADLLPVVRDHVYHPRFAGSFGLKNVAPALVPDLAYDSLEIAGGDEASQKLYELLLKREGMSQAEKDRLRGELLRYCRMDTEALVRLHRALGRLI